MKGTVKNNRRNARGSFVPTKVMGVRAELDFWERAERVATAQGRTRNALIVEATEEYCDKVERGGWRD